MSKELENIKMNEELKALERIKAGHFIECDICDANWHKGCMCCRESIRKSEEIEIIEKSLKALEISKEKECLFRGLSETTQEEFDLLMEVLR
jgi:hypothetical protein